MSLSASSSGPVFSGRTYFQAPALVFALIGPGVFFFRKPNDAPDNAAIPLRRSIRQLKLVSRTHHDFFQYVAKRTHRLVLCVCSSAKQFLLSSLPG